MNKMMIGAMMIALLTPLPSHAKNSGPSPAMLHANPVPNYVGVILRNATKLQLSQEQLSKVKAWKKQNGKRVSTMVKQVMAGEKAIKKASFDGASLERITEMGERLLDLRRNLIIGKTTCRDHIKSVLNQEQWKQLVAMMQK